MKWPKLAVVRPFPECPGPDLPFRDPSVTAHRWLEPTNDGVQVCRECGIWRLIEVPGEMLPDHAIDLRTARDEARDLRARASV